MTNLIQQQKKLQSEAHQLIEEIQLENLLRPYGDFEITGSLDYGLMSWRDIDINLLTPDTPKEEDYWKIVKLMFSLEKTKLLMLSDNRDKSTEANRPKSMYIGMKHVFKNEEWRFDIRLLARKDKTTDKVKELIEQNINETSKKVILEIKAQIHSNPKYHKDFSSVDIYQAVLLNKVENLTQFKNYLLKEKNVRT